MRLGLYSPTTLEGGLGAGEMVEGWGGGGRRLGGASGRGILAELADAMGLGWARSRGGGRRWVQVRRGGGSSWPPVVGAGARTRMAEAHHGGD